jgi:hypothetical protein
MGLGRKPFALLPSPLFSCPSMAHWIGHSVLTFLTQVMAHDGKWHLLSGHPQTKTNHPVQDSPSRAHKTQLLCMHTSPESSHLQAHVWVQCICSLDPYLFAGRPILGPIRAATCFTHKQCGMVRITVAAQLPDHMNLTSLQPPAECISGQPGNSNVTGAIPAKLRVPQGAPDSP